MRAVLLYMLQELAAEFRTISAAIPLVLTADPR